MPTLAEFVSICRRMCRTVRLDPEMRRGRGLDNLEAGVTPIMPTVGEKLTDALITAPRATSPSHDGHIAQLTFSFVDIPRAA